MYVIVMPVSNKILLTLSIFFAVNVQAGISLTLFEQENDQCTVRALHDAVPGSKGVIMLKVFAGGKTDCKMTKEASATALEGALQHYKSRTDLSEITSVFLGRLVPYKWLNTYLVEASKTSKQWDINKGRPVQGTSNQYVNTLLYKGKVLESFSRVLAKYNYKITGVSCEKVLINRDKLPFDAMCWLVIR